MEFISSIDNKTIKYMQSLTKKKYRQKYNSYLVEGLRNVVDTLSHKRLKRVLIKESYADNKDIQQVVQDCLGLNIPIFIVADKVYETVEDTVQGQGIIGEGEKKGHLLKNFKVKDSLYLLLDSVQDPGNLGTIIRTAVAVGVEAIFLTKGSVDPYNSKTVRSAMSALSKIDIYENITDLEVQALLTDYQLHTYAAALVEAVDYKTVNYQMPALLIVGNEGNGIRSEILEKTKTKITIPIYGDIESLNLSIATALCMYKIVEHVKK